MATYDSVVLVKQEVFVYKIPPRSTNRGYRWDSRWKFLFSTSWNFAFFSYHHHNELLEVLARFILINVVVLERPTGTWMSRHGMGGWEWCRRALRWTSNSKTKCQASSLPTVLWRHILAWPSSRSRTAHVTLCCAYKTTTDDQPSLAWDLV